MTNNSGSLESSQKCRKEAEIAENSKNSFVEWNFEPICFVFVNCQCCQKVWVKNHTIVAKNQFLWFSENRQKSEPSVCFYCIFLNQPMQCCSKFQNCHKFIFRFLLSKKINHILQNLLITPFFQKSHLSWQITLSGNTVDYFVFKIVLRPDWSRFEQA